MKLTNSDSMKRNNMKYVLETIRKEEPISRKSISEKVGLTTSSITNIVGQLIEDSYLIETGVGESIGGRKPIMLEINPKGGYAIGVEMDATDIICIITDFKANKIAENRGKTLLSEGVDNVMKRLIELIEETIEKANIPRERIMGIGLVSAGPYDYRKGTMINPPNFIGWHDVPIRDIVQDALGISTFFEKDTQGAAIAEYWFGQAENVQSLFAMIVKEVGVGGGIIINGNVYHGFQNGAGDIGHMVIDSEGPACSCGSYGCLETLSSGVAIANKVISRIKRGESSILSKKVDDIETINIFMVIEAFYEGDELCSLVIKNSAKYLGLAIADIINLFSPEMIVIGGQIPDMCPEFAQIAIEHAMRRKYPSHNKNVRIITSTYKEEQQAYGGVGVVFHNFFNGLLEV